MDALVNFAAEEELIGSLMQDNAAIDRVADTLRADDFAEPVMGRLFSAIVDLAAKGKPANPITLKGYFETDEGLKELGGIGYLARLSGQAMTLATGQIARLLLDLSTRRRMHEGLTGAATDCGDLTLTPAEIVSRADAALNVTEGDTINQPTLDESLCALVDNLGALPDGVRCGLIGCLDDVLGQIRPKQLVIGAGRPGMGKTAVALSYALGAAANGHGVLFVSLEMSAAELTERQASNMTFNGQGGVPYSAIVNRELNDWQRKEIRAVSQKAMGLPFQIVDAGSLTMGRLNMLVRRHKRRMAAKGQKLELVIVDYLQLLRPDSKGRSNYEAVSEISMGLKAMAKDQDIGILALAQLSREVEKRPDRRPQLSDLRDSGQIEQDADAVLFLLREEYYLRQSEPDHLSPDRAAWEHALQAKQGLIEFIVAKRRNGTTGTAEGRFHGAYQAVRGH